jgi:hypothetical protein
VTFRKARVIALLLSMGAAGCRHLLEPIEPRSLSIAESDAVRFPDGTTAWIENAHTERILTPILTEGLHTIEADLREWTARLVSEVGRELRRRGVAVYIPESSLRGTPIPLEPVPPLPGDPATFRKLRLRVSGLEPPRAWLGEGPRIRAEVESEDGKFTAAYVAGDGARGFRDALFDLKKMILDDDALHSWLRGAPSSTPGAPGAMKG